MGRTANASPSSEYVLNELERKTDSFPLPRKDIYSSSSSFQFNSSDHIFALHINGFRYKSNDLFTGC